MSKKIGSLFYEIGADTSKFKKGLGDSKTEVKGFADQLDKSFTETKSKINLFKETLNDVYQGLKQIYEFGKAGAELERTADSFDRLAESAGTTGDVLIRDLKLATKGLVSDFDLMASATDFLSLGLVKTHDEAVRLTRVAGSLGMDMNQLVLTLTNQTTMRFDALGVAVDGFDERLKKLKDSGMDTNAAFTEAFLQQAEEQIQRVGDVAESSVSSFKRFEASLENFNKKAQQVASGPIGDIVNVLANGLDVLSGNDSLTYQFAALSDSVIDANGSYDDYLEKINKVLDGTGLMIDANGELEATTLSGTVKLKNFTNQTEWLTEAEYNAAKATSGWTEETYAAYRGLSTMDSAVVDVTESLETINGMLGDASVLMQDYSDKLLFSAASAGMSAEEQIALAGAMGLVNGNTQYALEKVREYTVQLENGKITQQEYNDLVANLAGLMAALQDRDITVRVHAQIDSALNDYIGAGFGNQGTGQMTPQLQAGGGPAGSAFYWGEYGRSEIAFGRYGGGGAQVVNPQQLMEMIRSTIGGQSGGDTYNINITSNDSVGLAAYGAQMAKSKAMARI